jgi:hypothetical protein
MLRLLISAAIWTLTLSAISDRTKLRLPWLQLNGLLIIFGSVILGIHSRNIALNYVGFFSLYASSAGFYILWPWLSDVCAYSADLRTVIYATGTTGSYIYSATVGPAAWQASLAPVREADHSRVSADEQHWKIGPWITVAAISTGIVIVWPAAAWLARKQRIKQQHWIEHPEDIPQRKGFWPVQGLAE